jgi:hypothetical protein
MSDTPPTTRFRMSPLGWVMAGIVVMGIAAGTCLYWLRSEQDLRAVEAEIRAAGLPVSWQDAGLVPGSQARQDDWRRVQALARSIKSYALEDAGSWYGPKPGTPLPPALAEFHARLDARLLAELDATLLRLGPDPVYTRTERHLQDKDADVGLIRDLMRLYQERMALAPCDRISALADVMANLVPDREPPSLMSELVSSSLANLWLNGVALRLSNMSADDRRHIASLCDQLDGLLAEQSVQAARCAPIMLLQESTRVTSLSNQEIGMMLAFSSFMVGGGSGGGNPVAIWCENERIRFGIRAGRATVLRLCLQRARHYAADADPAACVRTIAALEAGVRRLEASAVTRAATLVVGGFALIDWSRLEARTALRLLAAELRGQPWPADPRDPTGHAYRRCERDGSLIGAYSVGKNGIDDAGQGDDRCINLYGVCRLPRP